MTVALCAELYDQIYFMNLNFNDVFFFYIGINSRVNLIFLIHTLSVFKFNWSNFHNDMRFKSVLQARCCVVLKRSTCGSASSWALTPRTCCSTPSSTSTPSTSC